MITLRPLGLLKLICLKLQLKTPQIHPGTLAPSKLPSLSLHFALSLFSHFLCLLFPSVHLAFLSLINVIFCPRPPY